jgi:transcriptional regulator with XRE-family HTH domain
MEENIKSPTHQALVLLGQHIRKRRIELGWSQITLAERAKVRIATICDFENGHVTDCKYSTLLAILGAMQDNIVFDWEQTRVRLTPEYLEANGFVKRLEPIHLRGFVKKNIVVRIHTTNNSDYYVFEVFAQKGFTQDAELILLPKTIYFVDEFETLISSFKHLLN